jgi:hypothetical protein
MLQRFKFIHVPDFVFALKVPTAPIDAPIPSGDNYGLLRERALRPNTRSILLDDPVTGQISSPIRVLVMMEFLEVQASAQRHQLLLSAVGIGIDE